MAAFAFPPRNPAYPTVEDVIYVEPAFDAPDEHSRLSRMYAMATGDEARRWRLQYLTVEEELERAYRYVAPCEANALTFSFKFADILRAAAGGYETLSKVLYGRFYASPKRLDIRDYLALERFLAMAGRTAEPLLAVGGFPSFPEVARPFAKMAGWDRASDPVPDWWAAYNTVKHETEGVESAATLANATAAVAALFLLIETVYGFAILDGGFICVPEESGMVSGSTPVPRWARLFAAGSAPRPIRSLTITAG